MLISEKINLRRYCILSIAILIATLCFSSWQLNQVLAMIGCSFGLSIGLLVTAHGVIAVTTKAGSSGGSARRDLRRALWLAAIKIPFMAGVLLGSIHFMDGLVLLPLVLYLGQMTALFFCLKKGVSETP